MTTEYTITDGILDSRTKSPYNSGWVLAQDGDGIAFANRTVGTYGDHTEIINIPPSVRNTEWLRELVRLAKNAPSFLPATISAYALEAQGQPQSWAPLVWNDDRFDVEASLDAAMRNRKDRVIIAAPGREVEGRDGTTVASR